jgi:hypothetical protein
MIIQYVIAHLFLDMYHGFDWYGRTLEVREVGRHVASISSSLMPLYRIGMLASQVQEASVEDYVAALVVWGDVDCGVVSEEASVAEAEAVAVAVAAVVLGMGVLVATSQTRIFTPITPVQINRLHLLLG